LDVGAVAVTVTYIGSRRLPALNNFFGSLIRSNHMSENVRVLGSGKAAITMPCQGFGAMGATEFYGLIDPIQVAGVFKSALKNTPVYIDTADCYGPWKNEILVGKEVGAAIDSGVITRDQVIIGTKCGVVRDPNDPTKRGVNNTPEYITTSCEASLKRLGLKKIDIYYLHRINGNPEDPQGASIEESMEAMAKLVNAGKIKYVGLSEASADQIRRADATLKKHTKTDQGLTAVQEEYSLLQRGIETSGVLNVCNELGIGIVAYSPLCRGLLTRKFNTADLADNDFRKTLPRFNAENIQENKALVATVNTIADDIGCTTSQVALAWVMQQSESLGVSIVPIPGTKTEKYFELNIAANKIHLSEQQMGILNSIGSPMGSRYAQAAMEAYGLKA
jgi:aryl-alcohol dehydrogenase-like predicted oxidoreductase